MALTLDQVREVDKMVRDLATYVPDPALRDSWTSYAREVEAGRPFEGDCDDWAQTALVIGCNLGWPKRQLFRALVSSTGEHIDHMIGLVDLGPDGMWTLGDTFGPPVKVDIAAGKAGPHKIIETARISEGRKWRKWAKKNAGRVTTAASNGMRTSAAGQSFMKAHEAFIAIAYDDFQPRKVLKPTDVIKGTLTIGYGHTGDDVYVGQRITKHDGDVLFDKDIMRFERGVRRLVRVPLKQHQFDALVSFSFNCGEANLASSTLLKKVNARAPEHEIQAQFRRWTRSKGKVLNGLVKRRNAEAAMWAGEVVSHGAIEPMQSVSDITPVPLVEEDGSAKKSKDTWMLGGILGGSGIGGSVQVWELIQEAFNDFKDAIYDGPALLVALVSIACMIIAGIYLYKRISEIKAAKT